jgi:hypothetical protein
MSTGPKTPAGKDTSSANAITHGSCSERLLLPGENKEEWNKLLESWFDDYRPQTKTFANLLVHTAEAEWLLRRNAKNYNELQNSLSENPLAWTEDDHKQLERFSRYRTTAERRFVRFRQAVEQTRKNLEIEAHRRSMLDLAFLKERNQTTGKTSKPSSVSQGSESETTASEPYVLLSEIKPIPSLRQSVEVRVKDGITKTTIHPSNEELIEKSKTKDPPAELIYRTIHFCDGFPPEYEWARNLGSWTSNAREQVFTPAQWLSAIERERQTGSGHIGPAEEEPSETNQTPTAEDSGTNALPGAEREKESEKNSDS